MGTKEAEEERRDEIRTREGSEEFGGCCLCLYPRRSVVNVYPRGSVFKRA